MTALRHRLPVRLRQHWRPFTALLAALAVLLIFFGDARLTPMVTSASDSESDLVTDDIQGTVDLYDRSVSHTIQLEYDEDDFQRMAERFQEDGEKEMIEADLTIDGTYIPSVGLRLKGNSTLQSLQGGGDGGRGGFPGGAGQQGQQQDTGEDTGQRGGFGGMAGSMARLSFDSPEELPWLISIDAYVEGRAYEGHQELAVRPGSDEGLPLNEAVSLSLMEASGQAAERFTFSSFTVNNRPTTTRFVVENPGPAYAAHAVGDNGVLYKARAGSQFTYQGDDPTAYEDDFNQLTKKGSQDLQPVIDLIRWAEDATDEEFAAELSEHVDVASFAAYAATQNLLLNGDDMAGPGRNYLLWYDLDTRLFTVLGWDFNLTLSGSADTGPDDETSMVGGGMGGGMGGGRGEAGTEGTEGPQGTEGADGGTTGQTPPEGFPGGMGEDVGGGMAPPEGFPGGAGGGGEGGGMTGGNTLKDRFLELDAFDDVYHDAYRELYETFYGSGTALDAIDSLVEEAVASGADADGLATAADRLRETVTARTEALAGEEVITG